MNSGSIVRIFAPLIVLAMALVSPPIAVALERPTLCVESATDHYWLCVVGQDPNDPQAFTSSIRYRENKAAGRWNQAARLKARVIDIAAVGDQLAVLTDKGEWQLLWDGGSSIGAPLPDGTIATDFASSGDSLFAVATPAEAGARRELYRWTQADGWQKQGNLPDGATPMPPALGCFNGQPWIAYPRAETLRVAKFLDGRWDEGCLLPASPDFSFVAGASTPLLARQDADGRLTVDDVHDAAASAVRSIDLTEPAAVAMVDATLRVVWVEGAQVRQTGFDRYGRGAQFGPDVIADVEPRIPPGREWLNVAVIGLLTIVMLATLRQNPDDPSAAAESMRGRLAPLVPRVVAGLIDLVPFLAIVGWYSGRYTQAPLTYEQQSLQLYLPVFVGLAIYIAHVMICELVFGRSIGKFIFGLKVVTVDGDPVPAGRIVLRNMLRVFDLLFVPLLLVMLSASSQRFGDMAARTLVIRGSLTPTEPPGDSAPPQSD